MLSDQQLKSEYLRLVVPFVQELQRITVPETKAKKVRGLVDKIIEKKRGERHHRIDFGNEYKRFYTGLLGEAAMEEHFGVDIIDWAVGCSSDFNSADLRSQGMDIGIKTVESGKFPIVHKQVSRPELINIKVDDETVVFCGYAPKSVLINYQNDEFILSKMLRARNTKSAFYGFEKLILATEIPDLGSLSRIYDENDRR
ncbi:MAG: hypothetical protein FWH32_07105 [Clostridiales bacterium]|nr:hypothetical protein [Clostridiales bacterium]